MGSQSKRFRASQTVDFELVHLILFLFLCLELPSRPAGYGHTFLPVSPGAFYLEQGPSETLSIVNPGTLYPKQGTSEVIAIPNSTRNIVGSTGEYSSAVRFLDLTASRNLTWGNVYVCSVPLFVFGWVMLQEDALWWYYGYVILKTKLRLMSIHAFVTDGHSLNRLKFNSSRGLRTLSTLKFSPIRDLVYVHISAFTDSSY